MPSSPLAPACPQPNRRFVARSNSFRIHGDGHDWGALSGAVNIMSSVAKFNRPGARAPATASPNAPEGPQRSLAVQSCAQPNCRRGFGALGLWCPGALGGEKPFPSFLHAHERKTLFVSRGQVHTFKRFLLSSTRPTWFCAPWKSPISDISTGVAARVRNGKRLNGCVCRFSTNVWRVSLFAWESRVTWPRLCRACASKTKAPHAIISNRSHPFCVQVRHISR